MSFDSELSKAEINQCAIKIRHNLRQIRNNLDNPTARYYDTLLRTLYDESQMTCGKILRERNKVVVKES